MVGGHQQNNLCHLKVIGAILRLAVGVKSKLIFLLVIFIQNKNQMEPHNRSGTYKPKRAKTPYQCFSRAMRDSIKKELVISGRSVTDEVHHQWELLKFQNSDEIHKYKQMARDDKQRYEREMKNGEDEKFKLLNDEVGRLRSEITHLKECGPPEDCPICLDPHEDVVKMKCRHTLCFDCFVKHARSSSTCPLCRDQFAEINRIIPPPINPQNMPGDVRLSMVESFITLHSHGLIPIMYREMSRSGGRMPGRYDSESSLALLLRVFSRTISNWHLE